MIDVVDDEILYVTVLLLWQEEGAEGPERRKKGQTVLKRTEKSFNIITGNMATVNCPSKNPNAIANVNTRKHPFFNQTHCP